MLFGNFVETLLSDDLSKVQAASGFECAKSSLHFGLQPQLSPNLINLSRNRRVFFDYPSPFAVGFARPFVGRVQAHFAAESADEAHFKATAPQNAQTIWKYYQYARQREAHGEEMSQR